MRTPKSGEEVFYVVPIRVCMAEWDGSPSLLEAWDAGYIFKSKVKAKRFCKALEQFYKDNAKKFR